MNVTNNIINWVLKKQTQKIETFVKKRKEKQMAVVVDVC